VKASDAWMREYDVEWGDQSGRGQKGM